MGYARFLVLFCFFVFSTNSFAAMGSFQHFSLQYHGHRYPYAVYLPPIYTPKTEWPMILFLHGTGEYGNDGMKPTTSGLGPAVARNPERFPAVIVYPQIERGQSWKNDEMVKMAAEALTAAETKFHGDPRRIYLTGLSLGGFGVWRLASDLPERFAAAVPIAGGGDPRTMARPLRDMPIWVFHGSADTNVPVTRDREMVAAIRAEGNIRLRYTEFQGVAHDSWDPAYAEPELSTWLFEQHN